MILLDEAYDVIVNKLKDITNNIYINAEPKLLDNSIIIRNTSDIIEELDLSGSIMGMSTEITVDFAGSSVEENIELNAEKTANNIRNILNNIRVELNCGYELEINAGTLPKQIGVTNNQLPVFSFVATLNIN